MRHQTLIVALALLICPVNTFDVFAGQQTIKGMVINRAGKPIPYATILAPMHSRPHRLADGTVVTRLDSSGFDQWCRRLTADGNGRFSYLASKEQGEFIRFAAVATGYSYGCGSSRQGAVEIRLSPEYRLKGKIVDEHGRPVAGARVRIADLGAIARYGEGAIKLPTNITCIAATTDKNGRYVLEHLPDPQEFGYCDFSLAVHKQGRASVRKILYDRYLPKEVVIVQPLGCVAEGTLHLPGRTAPAPPGIPVAINVISERGWEERQTLTDRNGRFCWSELPPGQTTIMLLPPGIHQDTRERKGDMRPWVAPALDGLTLNPNRPLKVEMTLTPGVIVRGVARTPDGQPAKGMGLSTWHAGIADGSSRREEAHTNDNGEFAVRVIPGRVQITTGQPGAYSEDDKPAASIAVAGSDETPVEITVEPTRRPSVTRLKDLEVKHGVYDLQWDQNLKCDHSWFPAGYGDRRNGAVLALLRGKPRYASKSVIYRAYRLDGRGTYGLLLMALDRSTTSGDTYDTVYIDSNRNFDLSDDEPVVATGDNDYVLRRTPWVEVQSHQGPRIGHHTNHSLQVRVEVHKVGADGPYCCIRRRGCWQGSVETNKGPVKFIVDDGNCSGSYSDINTHGPSNSVPDNGDHVRIDTSGTGGTLDPGRLYYSVPLYPISQISDRFYSIRVNPAGDRVTVQPYTGPTGSILISCGDIHGISSRLRSVALQSIAASYSFDDSAGKPMTVPVDSYLIKSCIVELQSAVPTAILCEPYTSVDVRQDRQSDICISGSISSAIEPSIRNLVWHAGRTERFTWDVRIGENCRLTGFYGHQPRFAPKLRFIDDKGITVCIVHAYSRVFNASPYVNVPDLKTGTYTVEASLDTWSQLGIITSKRQIAIEP